VPVATLRAGGKSARQWCESVRTSVPQPKPTLVGDQMVASSWESTTKSHGTVVLVGETPNAPHARTEGKRSLRSEGDEWSASVAGTSPTAVLPRMVGPEEVKLREHSTLQLPDCTARRASDSVAEGRWPYTTTETCAPEVSCTQCQEPMAKRASGAITAQQRGEETHPLDIQQVREGAREALERTLCRRGGVVAQQCDTQARRE
jgi:hypothetical protein